MKYHKKPYFQSSSCWHFSCHETCASQNITIDDTNLTAISYNPQTCTGAGATVGWKSEVTNGAINGSIQFCNEPGATVTFTFIGVAVWILSPLWPYNLTFQAALDSNNVTSIEARMGSDKSSKHTTYFDFDDANSAAGYHDSTSTVLCEAL
ncbi:hypothetical protein A0H81_13476 [Grifola frondosa]|uniref:Uncharacterized protein n=1 Tax=Grifola frondosa TaxID=5627 RepID=A0A1C7LUU2_GRIFR|nr:hypothetical protein A0H81_13476 [Grifola frondosa]